jgi:hypothetical protein
VCSVRSVLEETALVQISLWAREFLDISIMLRILHFHLLLNIAPMRRKIWRSLLTVKQSKAVSDVVVIEQKEIGTVLSCFQGATTVYSVILDVRQCKVVTVDWRKQISECLGLVFLFHNFCLPFCVTRCATTWRLPYGRYCVQYGWHPATRVLPAVLFNITTTAIRVTSDIKCNDSSLMV